MFFVAAILILIFALDVAWYWAILVCFLATARFTFTTTTRVRGMSVNRKFRI